MFKSLCKDNTFIARCQKFCAVFYIYMPYLCQTDQILQQQMIEKWDGKLPVVSGENGMMIDFDNLIENTTQSKQEN